MSVHAEPLIRSRTLRGRALSSMCGVACFVSCCHQTAAASNGLFSMSLSWLRGRFSLFLIRRPDSVSHVLFFPLHMFTIKKRSGVSGPTFPPSPCCDSRAETVSGEWRQSCGLPSLAGARVWDYGVTVNFHTKTSEKKVLSVFSYHTIKES